MDKEENPYASPLSSSREASNNRTISGESLKVRMFAACLALLCLPLPLSIEYSRTSFGEVVVALLSILLVFEFSIIACVGRPCLFRYVVDQPRRPEA